ncbi:MAG: NAD-dependent epimerase/dehydratase family protein [Alphaproteobacteria bacterium]|nr:NAD-dependent epimerase/dehydratase family protein [Alphaproteobacteria bacterium]
MSRPSDDRRAVVTGAGGFAGTWLCRHLRARGMHVVGWTRRPVADPVAGVIYRQQDLADGRATRQALLYDAPDLVFHLGAVSHVGDCAADPDRAIAVNVGGTEALLAGLRPGVPFVFASTCHVYGQPSYLPVDEDHALSPDSLYGRTKETAERIVLAAARSGLHAIVARAFHHTGPGQAPRYALADWAGQLAAGRRATMLGRAAAPIRTGDLTLRRDYTDVRDIVAGYALLADRAAPGDIVQLCSGTAHPLGVLLSWLAGGGMPHVAPASGRLRPADVPVLVGSPARAEALGWARHHDLRDTLPELVDWAEAHAADTPQA